MTLRSGYTLCLWAALVAQSAGVETPFQGLGKLRAGILNLVEAHEVEELRRRAPPIRGEPAWR